jgi:hypothetical protein
MEWVNDPEVKKTAQDMFEDDPQLDAIKDLPGMQDEIDELQGMSTATDVPPCGECSEMDAATGTEVEQAIEKVKDAAEEVANAAVKDVEKAVTDAVKNVGSPSAVVEVETTQVTDLDDTKPEELEKVEETEEKDDDDVDVPGVEGDAKGIEKESDEEKPLAFAAAKGMRRLAELSNDELKELRHYWKDLLGFPSEYVDAMLKKYRA